MEKLRETVLRHLNMHGPLKSASTALGALKLGRSLREVEAVWLHYVFPPLPDADAEILVANNPAYETSQLRRIHRKFNGLILYAESFFLFGKRTNDVRIANNVQPWDLTSANRQASAKLPAGALYAGGNNSQRGIDFIELSGGGEVIAVERNRWDDILFRWPDLQTCLLTELERLGFLFDEKGNLVDRSQLTNFSLKRN